MDIQQIRNATLVITYANQVLLIDPFLGDKGSLPPFGQTPNAVANPLVDLPVDVNTLLDPDAIFVTHLHADHFDDAAKQLLPKHLPLYAQQEEDAQQIREAGFTNVSSFDSGVTIGDIQIHRTGGRHGVGEIGERMGRVSGLVLTHPDEPTLYIAGDTIWCDEVAHAIEQHTPDIIVVNSGAAQFLTGEPITMSQRDLLAVHEAAAEATIIVSHLESVNHCLLRRDMIADFLAAFHLSAHFLIPDDGETMSF
ncbi:MBL fold metallo-hydrolase [Exiguobacterium acetylicum]|uniref:MBL fold metallo-hydrolase n=1 Tax=Exiguobacterium acetylicum TaxID=41170 RepID=UPI001EE279F9|nr:MBL fold metallo-hydrolase [Exiguobacterium acetylicum]UKS56513.1 MBL fold metallo-hydrolase [Exiguobacterium acetylicum]